ncbi:helix-turn-helix domain-containing protein [Sanguibacter sp. HDW7]|uniref:helix-turn-helix domain-containing protein n=1 Tax=Sanguibacter sp. HDW7 TaxID=2714931 RepID=UPI00140BEB2A|nr:helix-turn-helix domain-containing protein [Sanguibacter sp. HDW7]QIK83011.1 helix-turn-helix domain-containing protein [Sanguibacter sp. HDW7]
MTFDQTAYRKRWQYDRDRGVIRTVPAGPVKTHIVGLLDAGLTYGAIADLSGVELSTIHRIRKSHRTSVRIARAVLAVRADQVHTRPSHTGFVPNVGARRRISALLALGWTHIHISEAAGLPPRRSGAIMHQRGTWIARDTHDRIITAYDALSMRPGPSAITRRRAAEARYAPPLAWDDDRLDDPTATPEHGWNATPNQQFTTNERRAQVRYLTERGHTAAEIAERLGVTTRTVVRARARTAA